MSQGLLDVLHWAPMLVMLKHVGGTKMAGITGTTRNIGIFDVVWLPLVKMEDVTTEDGLVTLVIALLIVFEVAPFVVSKVASTDGGG